MATTEGFIPFSTANAGKPLQTWFRTHGDVSSSNPVSPIIVLHGGPGIPHDYLANQSALYSTYSFPVIFYDAIGCGKSTSLTEKKDDTSFLTTELYKSELSNLITHFGLTEKGYHILGHTWGAMLACEHAADQPKGLKSMVLANGTVSMPLWQTSVLNHLKSMPEDVQRIVQQFLDGEDIDATAFHDANMAFNAKHVCRVAPPKEMLDSLGQIQRDPTVLHTMFGKTAFKIDGPLKDWDIAPRLHEIGVPTLIINGQYDEADDTCIEPLHKGIRGSTWHKFMESSHMPLHEEPEEFLRVVGHFFKGHEV